MPQMKPMIWILMMMMTLAMILTTIIMNFFTTLNINKSNKQKSINSLKWEW